MNIRLSTDSDTWLALQNLIRMDGYRYSLQSDTSGEYVLCLEPQLEPEGGKLTHGLIVYPGGCEIGSQIQEIYDLETSAEPIKIQDRPAAKSSTSVAASATVCRSCGCRKGPNTQAKQGCTCRCH